jgi:flagellin
MNQEFQSRTINRLTSGYRINSSADDAAGLSVANKYRNDVTSLMQGVRNANDGISTLQIVDGGLNNVSKMLDRMTTLATQSASATFEGDRSILQTEYSSLIGEINRQASNVGLSSTSTAAGRYNKDINVFIGGGATAGNSSVSIDLSGATNLVDATGLNLTGTTIAGSTQQVTLSGVDYSGGTLYLATGSSQDYTFNTASGARTVSLQGDANGLLGSEIVSQLNTGLAGTGITASLDKSTGFLKLASSGSFSASVAASVGAGTQVQAAVASTAAVVNTGAFNFDGGLVTAITVAPQTVTFTPAGGSAVVVTLGTGDSVNTTFNNLKTALAGSGIDVIRSGSNVSFQSTKDFTVDRNASGTSSQHLRAITTRSSAWKSKVSRQGLQSVRCCWMWVRRSGVSSPSRNS